MRSGVDSLEKNDESGLRDLEAALALFPTYFDALNRLGLEYVTRKQFDKAYPLLLRAIDVNQRSYTAYYLLGWSFYKLNEIPAAIKAARACTVLVPNAADGFTLLGTALRIHGDLADAETSLRKAISLTGGKEPQAHWQMALLLN